MSWNSKTYALRTWLFSFSNVLFVHVIICLYNRAKTIGPTEVLLRWLVSFACIFPFVVFRLFSFFSFSISHRPLLPKPGEETRDRDVPLVCAGNAGYLSFTISNYTRRDMTLIPKSDLVRVCGCVCICGCVACVVSAGNVGCLSFTTRNYTRCDMTCAQEQFRTKMCVCDYYFC